MPSYLVGCSCREGNDGCVADFVDNGADAPVFGAEVMSPLRDTVCFVDGIERDFDTFEELHVLLLRQRFRGDIQQLGLAGEDVALHLVDGSFGQRRIDEVRHSVFFAYVPYGIHLVFHQGYQRRDYNSRPLHQ